MSVRAAVLGATGLLATALRVTALRVTALRVTALLATGLRAATAFFATRRPCLTTRLLVRFFAFGAADLFRAATRVFFLVVFFATALRPAVFRAAARFRPAPAVLRADFRRVVPAALRLAIAVVLSVPTYLDCVLVSVVESSAYRRRKQLRTQAQSTNQISFSPL